MSRKVLPQWNFGEMVEQWNGTYRPVVISDLWPLQTVSKYWNSKISLLLSLRTTTYIFLLVVHVTIVEHEIKVVNTFLCTWILLRVQFLFNCSHVHRMFYYAIIILQRCLTLTFCTIIIHSLLNIKFYYRI